MAQLSGPVLLLHPVLYPWWIWQAIVMCIGVFGFHSHAVGHAVTMGVAASFLFSTPVLLRLRSHGLSKLAGMARMLAFAPSTVYIGVRLFLSSKLLGPQWTASNDGGLVIAYVVVAFLTLTTMLWLDVCDVLAYVVYHQRGYHGDKDTDHSKCPFVTCTVRYSGRNPVTWYISIFRDALAILPAWMYVWLTILSLAVMSPPVFLPDPLAVAGSFAMLIIIYLNFPLAVLYGGLVKLMGFMHLFAIVPMLVFASIRISDGTLTPAMHAWAWCYIIVNVIGSLFDINDGISWFLLGHRFVLKKGVDESKLPKAFFGHVFSRGEADGTQQ